MLLESCNLQPLTLAITPNSFPTFNPHLYYYSAHQTSTSNTHFSELRTPTLPPYCYSELQTSTFNPHLYYYSAFQTPTSNPHLYYYCSLLQTLTSRPHSCYYFYELRLLTLTFPNSELQLYPFTVTPNSKLRHLTLTCTITLHSKLRPLTLTCTTTALYSKL